MTWVIVLLLVLAAIALLVGAVVVKARRLKATSRRLVADALEPVRPSPPVAYARGAHLRTTLLGNELDACLPDFPPGLHGDLAVTERDLLITDASGEALLHLPLSRVVEPALLRSFNGIDADEVGALLRVSWERGGETLASVFAVDGRRVEAERLRREIHLRSGKGRLPTLSIGMPEGPPEGG